MQVQKEARWSDPLELELQEVVSSLGSSARAASTLNWPLTVLLKRVIDGAWRDGSAIKSTGSRKPEFNFWNPHGGSQSCVTPVPRDQTHYYRSCRHQAHTRCTDIHARQASIYILKAR